MPLKVNDAFTLKVCKVFSVWFTNIISTLAWPHFWSTVNLRQPRHPEVASRGNHNRMSTLLKHSEAQPTKCWFFSKKSLSYLTCIDLNIKYYIRICFLCLPSFDQKSCKLVAVESASMFVKKLSHAKRQPLRTSVVAFWTFRFTNYFFTILIVHCIMSPDCSLSKNFEYLAPNVWGTLLH